MEISANPYKVITAPAVLPLTVTDVKNQLKMSTDADAVLDPLLLVLIGIATDVAEKITRRDLITRTYKTYRDFFPRRIEIQRCPVQSITSIQYYKDGVLNTVDPAVYYTTEDPDGFPLISVFDTKSWPEPIDQRLQAVQITFKSGYGDTAAAVPDAIKQGMLQHISQMYMHRGDNDFPNANDSHELPAISRTLYYRFKVPLI